MRNPDIRGKKITVLGGARSGVAVAKLLKQMGVQVFLSEKAPIDGKREQLDILMNANIRSEFGGHTDHVFDADGWIVSPGIPFSSTLLQEAIRKHIPIWGELEVASWYCQAPIIAVTGSNGKSTTTALIGEIFKTANIPCVVAGNIGQPLSDYVLQTVPNGVAVVEVSSFQLETIQYFHPKVALFLNLTPDLLDRHGSMENYGKTKCRLFENQMDNDYLIYNGRDKLVVELIGTARSQRVVFGKMDKDSDCGYVAHEMMRFRLHHEEEAVLPVHEMVIRGDHNILNGVAAGLAARLMGVEIKFVSQALKTFKGLTHRMEFVREKDNIEWINDSKATNVDSVWYALGSFDHPIILIAGGRDKDSDFSVLRNQIGKRVRSIVLMGEAADKMEEAFQGVCPLKRASSLQEAVFKARSLAQPGDTVLLSPGCASFDMFENFEDRGDQFKKIVEQF